MTCFISTFNKQNRTSRDRTLIFKLPFLRRPKIKLKGKTDWLNTQCIFYYSGKYEFHFGFGRINWHPTRVPIKVLILLHITLKVLGSHQYFIICTRNISVCIVIFIGPGWVSFDSGKRDVSLGRKCPLETVNNDGTPRHSWQEKNPE